MLCSKRQGEAVSPPVIRWSGLTWKAVIIACATLIAACGGGTTTPSARPDTAAILTDQAVLPGDSFNQGDGAGDPGAVFMLDSGGDGEKTPDGLIGDQGRIKEDRGAPGDAMDVADGDAGRADGTDIGGLPEDCPGGFRCPCKTPVECTEGFCIAMADGLRCTVTCFDSCPAEGFACVPTADQDNLFICAPLQVRLCFPCLADADCLAGAQSGARCLDFGAEGKFCGGSCGGGVGCPPGFRCDAITLPTGVQTEQCKPVSGVCTCPPDAISKGLGTTCFQEIPMADAPGNGCVPPAG